MATLEEFLKEHSGHSMTLEVETAAGRVTTCGATLVNGGPLVVTHPALPGAPSAKQRQAVKHGTVVEAYCCGKRAGALAEES